ncbi:unnamed protein product [Lampetra planeri]
MRADWVDGAAQAEDDDAHFDLPGIVSLRDLQWFLYRCDGDRDGLVTYDDVRRQLGDGAPTRERFLGFDLNHDRQLSYTEMRLAAGILQ